MEGRKHSRRLFSDRSWNRKLSGFEILWALTGNVVGIVLIGVAITCGYSPVKVFGFALASYIPALLLHELGHAFAGVALGGTIARISLGLVPFPSGKHLSFRFIGFPWEVYNVPISGSVLVYFTNPQRYRARLVLMIAAGPSVSLVSALVGAGMWRSGFENASAAVFVVWSLVNAYFFVRTSIPFSGAVRAGISQTDGSRILHVLKLTDQQVAQQVNQARLNLELAPERAIMERLSVNDAIARYESRPEQLATLLGVLNKLIDAEDDRQFVYLKIILKWPGVREDLLTVMLDEFLTNHLIAGTVNSAMEEFSRSLIELSKYSITSLGTHGSVLIDLGRVEEGKSILREVLDRSEAQIDKAFAHTFLALAAVRDGKRDEAYQHARDAASVDPACPALVRVSNLLG